MKFGKENKAHRLTAQHKQTVDSLKRCPLCGAINSVSNRECFKCSWYGNFDTDPEIVEAGLGELLTLCPELADAMSDGDAPEAPPKFLARVRQSWNRTVNKFFRALTENRKTLHRA